MSAPRQVVPGRVYLITRRCTQRQFLLRPDPETNEAFLYCLGYAASVSGVRISAFMASSNHYHAVVTDLEGRLPEFLACFHKLLAKHQNALRGRWENMWSSEHSSVVELIGSDDIVAKMVYTMTNPAKDHLVERAHHWPGANSLQATLNAKVVRARRPLRFFRRDGYMPESIEVRCVPPPGLDHLSQDQYAQMLRELIAAAEERAAEERRRTGRRVLGRKAILAQDPFDRPISTEPRRQLDPRIAARDKLPRLEAIARLKAFRSDYADSRRRWLKGEEVLFPCGTWWLSRHGRGVCVATMEAKPPVAESSA